MLFDTYDLDLKPMTLMFELQGFKSYGQDRQTNMYKIFTCPLSRMVKRDTDLLAALADPGGRRRHVSPPPTGSISFILAYVFAKKCTHRRLVPPQRVGAPQREILDPPLSCTCFDGLLNNSFLIICLLLFTPTQPPPKMIC